MTLYPTISKAIREMLYDNGCVNRAEPDRTDEIAALFAREFKPEYLAAVEAELARLPPDSLTIAVAGEEGERRALGLSDDAEGLLEMVFDAL